MLKRKKTSISNVIYQNWNRTPVYLEIVVSASHKMVPGPFQMKVWTFNDPKEFDDPRYSMFPVMRWTLIIQSLRWYPSDGLVLIILHLIISFLMWALCMVCSVGRQGLYIAFSPPFPPTLPDMKNMHKNTKTNTYTYKYRGKYKDKRTFHVNKII